MKNWKETQKSSYSFYMNKIDFYMKKFGMTEEDVKTVFYNAVNEWTRPEEYVANLKLSRKSAVEIEKNFFNMGSGIEKAPHVLVFYNFLRNSHEWLSAKDITQRIKELYTKEAAKFEGETRQKILNRIPEHGTTMGRISEMLNAGLIVSTKLMRNEFNSGKERNAYSLGYQIADFYRNKAWDTEIEEIYRTNKKKVDGNLRDKDLKRLGKLITDLIELKDTTLTIRFTQKMREKLDGDGSLDDLLDLSDEVSYRKESGKVAPKIKDYKNTYEEHLENKEIKDFSALIKKLEGKND